MRGQPYDIQISWIYILNENDDKVSLLMNNLSSKGLFNLQKKEIERIKVDFEGVKITDEETENIINSLPKVINRGIILIFDLRD